PQDLIEKKRDKQSLTRDEIAFLIRGYTRDEIPDYQMAAWLMASFLNGMNETETTVLLEEMLHSGDVLRHDEIAAPKVDKHSTGGVGDKTSLVIAPVAAACGLCVPMISGRALAHSGGTLDKLEAIPGFRTNLSLEEFKATLQQCGVALIGQTKEIAPADRKLYALRDLTATVPFRPFIVASILSKKLAEGIDGLVLDVKFGNGAFMKTVEDARELAQMLVKASRAMGKRTVALLTNMNQPLGRWVGNAVETMEAIEVLRGHLDGDFAELCIELAAQMLMVGGVTEDIAEARHRAVAAIQSGAALQKFKEVVAAQGGITYAVFLDKMDEYVIALLQAKGETLSEAEQETLAAIKHSKQSQEWTPYAKYQHTIPVTSSGYVSHIQTDEIGRIVMEWGGGRQKLEDPIDYAVGLYIHAKLGDRVSTGDPLVTAYFNDQTKLEEMTARLRNAYEISDNPPQLEPLVKEII
ncbi:MAG TPA: thymidine phosphorylase, partial [Blastocatellia bacterium]|nr:thymidine phosphorylase [Blastocatellia bacterium]